MRGVSRRLSRLASTDGMITDEAGFLSTYLSACTPIRRQLNLFDEIDNGCGHRTQMIQTPTMRLSVQKRADQHSHQTEQASVNPDG